MPVQIGGGMGVGVNPPGIPTSGGIGLRMRPRNRRSHQSSPLLFLSPGGPVTFFGDEFDAVGTATILVQLPAVKVTLEAPDGGIGLLSANLQINHKLLTRKRTPYRRNCTWLSDAAWHWATYRCASRRYHDRRSTNSDGCCRSWNLNHQGRS